ncbi:MAG: 16S rRNA (cytidine(1402)-2'-O)-methyltransferase [Synergistaceae bacterium]|nr:16S rRNA (cytidine(1402)-2'-O)-methyltransferase [Synergistaceae bacterium]
MPLILVPTPIGNLEDITLRALRVLRKADIIACEDTRTTFVLLKRYNIKKQLVSYHAHNERERGADLLNKLLEGKVIALVSDAGTPGISDPGYTILKLALENNIEIDALPGPNAILPALLLSGLPPYPFLFLGFPPEKKGERRELLSQLSSLPYTLCFYISPHKAAAHINDMIEIFGDRRASLVREISKIYQEASVSTLGEIRDRLCDGVKGELVLVVSGYDRNNSPDTGADDWKLLIPEMLKNGMSVRDITEKILQEVKGVNKNEIKDVVLAGKKHLSVN